MKAVRRETLPVLVADEIRRDILHGILKPGEKLPSEGELSSVLAVGRPTMREALRILEGQGLIRFRFSGGAYVSNQAKVGQEASAYFKQEETIELLGFELVQLEQEGRAVTDEMRKAYLKLKEEHGPRSIQDFYRLLEGCDPVPGFRYEEPSDMAAICRCRPSGAAEVRREVGPSLAKLHGAWLGRCIGCTIGKPFEGWTMENIEAYLRASDCYPLTGYAPYFPENYPGADCSFHPTAIDATSGKLGCVPRDDDIDYTILGLDNLLKNGMDFTTEDLAEEWLENLPFKLTYTAEKQAYANLVNGIKPPATALYQNPFREWVGAQIRSDIYGYVCPGDPGGAAALAYKDAVLSHVKNGVYGAMFVAATLASALAGDDLAEAIETGISVVPAGSRLAELVSEAMQWSREGLDWRAMHDRALDMFPEHHPAHVLPNVAAILIGLLRSESDFRTAVTRAVMCGWDTDCVGATTGSIMGAFLGVDAVPRDLSKPLNDTVKSIIPGYDDSNISELARKTYDLIR